MAFRYALFWGCVALTAAAEVLIVHAAFRPPEPPVPTADVGAPFARAPRGREILWALLPPPVLALVFWAAWRALVR